MIKYDKLVRDKIPEIIKASNKECKTHTVAKEETIKYLIQKISEETSEFEEFYSKEELADLLEVIHGLVHHLNYDFVEIETIRKVKKENRGGFEKSIILDSVLD